MVTDPEVVEQVIVNLLINAAQAADKKSTADESAAKAELSGNNTSVTTIHRYFIFILFPPRFLIRRRPLFHWCICGKIYIHPKALY